MLLFLVVSRNIVLQCHWPCTKGYSESKKGHLRATFFYHPYLERVPGYPGVVKVSPRQAPTNDVEVISYTVKSLSFMQLYVQPSAT
jgi:hypothetical protein